MAYTNPVFEQQRAQIMGGKTPSVTKTNTQNNTGFVNTEFENQRIKILGTSKPSVTPAVKQNPPTKPSTVFNSNSKSIVKISKPQPFSLKNIAKEAFDIISSPDIGSYIAKKTGQKVGSGEIQPKKLASSFVTGAKTVPGMTQQAGGIILDNIIQTNKAIDSFYRPIRKFETSILPNPLNKNAISIDQQRAKNLQGLEKIGQSMRESGIQSQQKVLKEYSKNNTASKGLQGYLEMAAFNLPQMMASTGLTVATGILTKNPGLATAVGLSTSYGLGASEVYNDARSFGLSDKKALPLAQVGGAIIGAIDYLPLERLLRKTGAFEPAKRVIEKSIIKSIVEVGVQAGFEGITEGLQEVVGNAIKRTYNENQNLFEGVSESAIVGAILGGFGDVTTSGAVSLLGNKASTESITIETEKKINEALDTPKEKRTFDQQQIVEALTTQTLTPQEATAFVVKNNLDQTLEGKEIMKKVSIASQNNQSLQLKLSEDGSNLVIDVVDKNFTPINRDKLEGKLSADESLLVSDQAQEVENKDNPRAQQAREKIKDIQENIDLRRQENEMKKSILDQFTSTQIKTMRALKKSIESRTNKGLDTMSIEELPSYKNHIRDIMAAIGTNEESEAVRYIIEDLPDTIIKADTKEELKQIEVYKSHIKPKEVTTSRENLPVGEGKEKISRLEARMKQALDGASQETIDKLGLSTYKEVNKKENIAKAAEFVIKSPNEALKVLRGEVQAPEGILRNAIFVAMQNEAKGDVNLARKLASLESTRLGQELSILTEIDPDSPVSIIDQIIKIREEAIKRKYGDNKKAVKSTKESITKEITKIDKYDWNDFINSIEC